MKERIHEKIKKPEGAERPEQGADPVSFNQRGDITILFSFFQPGVKRDLKKQGGQPDQDKGCERKGIGIERGPSAGTWLQQKVDSGAQLGQHGWNHNKAGAAGVTGVKTWEIFSGDIPQLGIDHDLYVPDNPCHEEAGRQMEKSHQKCGMIVGHRFPEEPMIHCLSDQAIIDTGH
jgi:hypothetical protein